jgi:hypothetical protein
METPSGEVTDHNDIGTGSEQPGEAAFDGVVGEVGRELPRIGDAKGGRGAQIEIEAGR